MTIVMPDGTLILTQTADCAIYAHYDNRYAPGDVIQVYHVGQFTVTVVKGANAEPESLIVRDDATGLAYRADIAENASGTICVGWQVMS